MTKDEILAELSLLPTSTLEKLLNYSELLIIPNEDMLVNVNMQQMVDKALNDYAVTYFPEWTDKSTSDFGRFLIELFGLFSEKDFYYINGFGNASLLRKMVVYSTAFIRAVELGYTPILTTAASASIKVTFEANANPFTYPIGGLVVELKDANNNKYKFTNIEPFEVPASGSPTLQTLTLYEGDWLGETQSFNGYRCDVRKTYLDVNSLRVYVNDVPWTRVNVFGQSDSGSKHFAVLPETNGSLSVYFGEDGYGATPSVGDSVTLNYLKCNGSAPNAFAATSSSVTKYHTARKATAAYVVSAPSGGKDAESLADLINNTQNYFTTKFACYNETSVEKWLLMQEGVKRADATIIGNEVFIRIVPTDGTVATLAAVNAFVTSITPYLSNGYNGYGVVTTYVDCATIEVNAYLLDGYDTENAKELIKEMISDWTNPLVLADYGGDFTLTEVAHHLMSHIPGLQNVVFVTVAGVPAANITVESYEILKKVETTSITVNILEV